MGFRPPRQVAAPPLAGCTLIEILRENALASKFCIKSKNGSKNKFCRGLAPFRFAPQSAVFDEIRRENALASKHFRLYYKMQLRFCKAEMRQSANFTENVREFYFQISEVIPSQTEINISNSFVLYFFRQGFHSSSLPVFAGKI